MSYKAPDKSFRMVRPTLPGFGRVGPWSTGVRQKAQADAIAVWLKETAITQPAVVQGIIDGKYSLRSAVAAKNAGTLDVLVLNATDPPLGDAAAEFARTTTDQRVREGLARLEEFANVARKELEQNGQSRVRLTWLLHHRHVVGLYAAAEASGMAANSVCRSIHRVVADLLANRYGKARRNAVMADVAKPLADDTRSVNVTPEELRALLAACDPTRFRMMVGLAILCGVDRAPLLRLVPRHFDEVAGTLHVLDTKTDARPRTLTLPPVAMSMVRAACAGLGPEEPVFPYTCGSARGTQRRGGRPAISASAALWTLRGPPSRQGWSRSPRSVSRICATCSRPRGTP